MSEAEHPILVTGAGGMLGRAADRVAQARGLSVIGLTKSQLDITDRTQVGVVTRELKPRVILNLAAYTAVDRAESEPDRAMAVNQSGAANIAAASREVGARMIHVSTDYVFDGYDRQPYRPADNVNPLNVYGRTKWLGEQSVRAELEDHLIVRTSWLFAPWGRNFVRTIARRAREHQPLRVVADQCGRPTSAVDFASALLDVAGRRDVRGTLHFANSDPTTWCAFAEAIVATLAAQDPSLDQEVIPIAAADWPTPASRPAYSVLDTEAFTAATGIVPRSWRAALSDVVAELT
jgi:dTDP-4-dehydrorhamnose reductase